MGREPIIAPSTRAYRLSPETRALLPEIPWDDIIGMRHRLVHAHFDISLDIQWRSIEQDLPALEPVLEPGNDAEDH